ncbi:hypothetical protein HDV00_011580 [Rhizophlyctis rosea]|nr:hypothetical protein HDV00_011580 [Rhizophlyctis rosea]
MAAQTDTTTFNVFPRELLIRILASTDNPKPLSRTCRLWHAVGQDPHAIVAFLVYQFGLKGSLHRLHHFTPWRHLVTSKVCELLLNAGAILPRFVVQHLLAEFEDYFNPPPEDTYLFGNPLLGSPNEWPPLPNSKSSSPSCPPFVKTLVKAGTEQYGDCSQKEFDDIAFYRYLATLDEQCLKKLEQLVCVYRFVPKVLSETEWGNWESEQAREVGRALGRGRKYNAFYRSRICESYRIYAEHTDERALIYIVQSNYAPIYNLFTEFGNNGFDIVGWKQRYNNDVVKFLLRYGPNERPSDPYVSLDTLVSRGFTVNRKNVQDAFTPLSENALSYIPNLTPYLDMETLVNLAISGLKQSPSLNHVPGGDIYYFTEAFPHFDHDLLIEALWSLPEGNKFAYWEHDNGIFAMAKYLGDLHPVPLGLFERALEHMDKDVLLEDKLFACITRRASAQSESDE